MKCANGDKAKHKKLYEFGQVFSITHMAKERVDNKGYKGIQLKLVGQLRLLFHNNIFIISSYLICTRLEHHCFLA